MRESASLRRGFSRQPTYDTRKRPIVLKSGASGLCEEPGELPASAVAATAARAATSAAAHLGEAVAAIHGLITARLERHARLAATVRAHCGIHLARGTLAAISTRHGRLARGPAFRAARRSVRQPLAGVKLLFADCENEVPSTVATAESLIGGQSSNLLSGPGAPLRVRTPNGPTRREALPTTGETL